MLIDFVTNSSIVYLVYRDEHERDPDEAKPTPPPRHRNPATVYHAPLPTPPPDDMEPQSVSFVQDDTTPLANELGSMSSKKSSINQITSGSKTYRITPESGSPPRPSAQRLFTSDAPGGMLYRNSYKLKYFLKVKVS